MKKGYSAERYLGLFDQKVDGVNGADNVLRPGNVGRYRLKTVRHGNLLDLEIFPIWNTASEEKAARKAKKRNPKAQEALNERNARKRLDRLVNENFNAGDIKLDLTYDDEHLPTYEQAYRDITNYFRRVKRYRKKHGLGEMKYYYRIEYADEEGVEKRGHHHVIMSGMDRDDAEKLWGKGRANADRIQPDSNGSISGAAIYLVKTGKRAKGKHRWAGSKNLKQPGMTVADTKLSRRRAYKLAQEADAFGKDLFENFYPGYAFTEVEVKYSEFVAGVYIYARMRRRR